MLRENHLKVMLQMQDMQISFSLFLEIKVPKLKQTVLGEVF